jgi:hypothetical protein
MTLTFNVDRVHEVLLADGWHPITEGSFVVDHYEYLDPAGRSVWAGAEAGGQVTGGEGFQFAESDGQMFAGPLTSLLAVRLRPNG